MAALIPGFLRDFWAWLTLSPEHVIVGVWIGAFGQLALFELLKLVVLRGRE